MNVQLLAKKITFANLVQLVYMVKHQFSFHCLERHIYFQNVIPLYFRRLNTFISMFNK